MNELIFIASDHAGFDLKKQILSSIKVNLIDLGADSKNSVDYPDYAKKLVSKINSNKNSKGILICGSGVGMSIAANRHGGIRAALCSDKTDVELARKHNDANILVLAGSLISVYQARQCVKMFFSTKFEGGRHRRRVNKLG